MLQGRWRLPTNRLSFNFLILYHLASQPATPQNDRVRPRNRGISGRLPSLSSQRRFSIAIPILLPGFSNRGFIRPLARKYSHTQMIERVLPHLWGAEVGERKPGFRQDNRMDRIILKILLIPSDIPLP